MMNSRRIGLESGDLLGLHAHPLGRCDCRRGPSASGTLSSNMLSRCQFSTTVSTRNACPSAHPLANPVRVLVLEKLQPPELTHARTRVPLLPDVERRLRDSNSALGRRLILTGPFRFVTYVRGESFHCRRCYRRDRVDIPSTLCQSEEQSFHHLDCSILKASVIGMWRTAAVTRRGPRRVRAATGRHWQHGTV